MQTKTLLQFSFFLLMTFFICGGCKGFQKKDNQLHYTIKTGETFQVMLDNNPSTGSYICFLNEQSMKAATLTRSEWIRDGAEDRGETEVYTFKGISKGTDSIKMKTMYVQNQQPGCPHSPGEMVGPDKLFLVTVEYSSGKCIENPAVSGGSVQVQKLSNTSR